MKTRSVKRQLIASVLLVELISAVCITGLAYVYERHTHLRTFDIMLRGRADSLLGSVQDADDAEDNVMMDGTQVNLPERDIFQVWDGRGVVLGKSTNWDGLANVTALDGLGWKHQPFQRLIVNRRKYGAIRLDGIRVVDPGEKGGGIVRHVTILYAAPLEPVWHAIRDAVVFYASTSLALLLVTGFVMLLVLRSGLAPLHDLAMEAAAVSVTSWNFSPSDRVLQTVELAPLASTLTVALKRLEKSFAQQNRFVSDAAHELKTAVAVVKSSLQLLTMRPRSTTEYQAGLERCQLDCERVEETVSRMLTLAQIESEAAAEAAARSRYSTNVGEVVRDIVLQFEPIADIGRVTVEVLAADAVTADIDPEQFHVLCSNLILNAIQHSRAGGIVRLRAESKAASVEIQVVDSGDGIDPEVLPHIFDRFYRSDPSRSRKTGGTGLGLAISKAIALRFQGSIEIESTPGKGTSVMVNLPVARASSVVPKTA